MYYHHQGSCIHVFYRLSTLMSCLSLTNVLNQNRSPKSLVSCKQQSFLIVLLMPKFCIGQKTGRNLDSIFKSSSLKNTIQIQDLITALLLKPGLSWNKINQLNKINWEQWMRIFLNEPTAMKNTQKINNRSIANNVLENPTKLQVMWSS